MVTNFGLITMFSCSFTSMKWPTTIMGYFEKHKIKYGILGPKMLKVIGQL
jgi:hypothetical protein